MAKEFGRIKLGDEEIDYIVAGREQLFGDEIKPLSEDWIIRGLTLYVQSIARSCSRNFLHTSSGPVIRTAPPSPNTQEKN